MSAIERDLKFSPKAAATTANTFDITFPNLVANKVLSVNSAGNGLEFAQDITDIITIAGIASDVTTVSGIAVNVTAVANDATDIGIVATNIASVNTVATNIADVIKVADDLNEAVSEVETVANDLNEAVSEIDVVANNITDVNTVGNSTNINNISLVAGQISPTNNISTVAAANANITAIGNDLSGSNTIGTVSTNIVNVNLVGNSISNVNTVASDLSGSNTIGTVATNIVSVNSFANIYRIGSTNPTTSLDEGDLFYNTTDNRLKFYDGSAWTNIEPPTTTGLATNGFAIAMAIAL